MNLLPAANGLMPPHYAPHIQPTLPPQQPGLVPNHHDMSQQNPRDAHFDNPRHPEPFNNANPFPMTASNVPQGPAQNANFPSHPFLFNGSLPWNFIWPSVLPSLQDRPCQHTSADQNVQASGSCPNCPTHPTAGAFQFGAGQPAPTIQENTALSMATSSSSSSSSSNPTAPLAMPPISEAPSLLHPDVSDAGPSASTRTSTENAYARKSRRVPPARNPRRRREVPLVRVEEHIEWVRHDIMKMTLWFNWSPDADAEAHEAWG